PWTLRPKGLSVRASAWSLHDSKPRLTLLGTCSFQQSHGRYQQIYSLLPARRPVLYAVTSSLLPHLFEAGLLRLNPHQNRTLASLRKPAVSHYYIKSLNLLYSVDTSSLYSQQFS